MYEGYSNAVYETLPSGAVIVDRIHVAKNTEAALLRLEYRKCKR